MPRDIDLLTSFTLKHLRDRWWDAAFTDFLRDAMLPQPGERVLDVGCGAGTAELILALLQPGQAQFVGIDLVRGRVADAQRAARDHHLAATLATADVAALPFQSASFAAAFAVAVLQHVEQPEAALASLARVMAHGGRLVVVEPDNAHRQWYSEPASGHAAFELATRFFGALESARREQGDPSLGPRLPGKLRRHGFDPVAVHLFPVSVSRIGAPVARVWVERRRAIEEEVAAAHDQALARLGRDLVDAVGEYARDADLAGPAFIEIQHTMLYATVAQRA